MSLSLSNQLELMRQIVLLLRIESEFDVRKVSVYLKLCLPNIYTKIDLIYILAGSRMITFRFISILFLVYVTYALPHLMTSSPTNLEEESTPGGNNIAPTTKIREESSSPLVGEVKLYAGDKSFLPHNWVLCHGQALSRTQYQCLFSVIGESFGKGDVKGTFNVPDLRGRFVMGRDSSKFRTRHAIKMGDTGGSAKHTLKNEQLPAHSHGSGSLRVDKSGLHTHKVSDPGHAHNFNYGSWGLEEGKKYVQVPVDFQASWGPLKETIQKSHAGISIHTNGDHRHTLTGNTETTGNGKSISLLNPYQILDYIIFTGNNDNPDMNVDATNGKLFFYGDVHCKVVTESENGLVMYRLAEQETRKSFSIFNILSCSSFSKNDS